MAKEKPLEETLDEVREDDGQIYVPRDDVDFDPDEGLLSGTAIDGTSDIPDEPSDAAGSDAEKSDADDDSADKSDDDSADKSEQ
jgi:hypothetical protein